MSSPAAPVGAAEAAAHLALGARLRSYRFDRYKTRQKRDQQASLDRLAVATAAATAAQRAFEPLEKTAQAVFFIRDLVSEPANVIYPETLAAQALQLAELGVAVEILDEQAMKKLGMNALLGVAQGSARPPRLVVMEWRGAPAAAEPSAPLAFVGKGVTFDTGGISIKPAAGMGDMKWDMAGSAVVIGLMRLLAARRAKVDAVGVVGLVENMPSGTAQRPGDIVSSMSGQTIEVLNTDAEGRLVLADALWYCQQRFKPRLMIDLATLTGAVIVALGHQKGGLFANDDMLAKQLVEAGHQVREELWRLPLDDELRPRSRQRRRRRQEHRHRPRRRQRPRRPVPAALCRQDAMGPSRHRRDGLVDEGRADRAEGRYRLRPQAARPVCRAILRAALD